MTTLNSGVVEVEIWSSLTMHTGVPPKGATLNPLGLHTVPASHNSIRGDFEGKP